MERYKYYKIDDSQTSVLPLCTNINTYLYSWIDGILKEGRKERIRIAARKEKNRDWIIEARLQGDKIRFLETLYNNTGEASIWNGERARRGNYSKRGESRARRGAVGDCSRTFGATRFLLLYSSSFPPCSFSKLLTPPLFSPVIDSELPEKNQSLHESLRFYPTNPRKSSPRKIPKIRGILKSVEDSASKSVDTNSFFSRKGVPLNRHARSSRLASRGHPKTGQGRYGEEGVARGGKETERQLSRFQNRRVARARHSLGGHPCDLPEEFTGRPGSARAGSSPNLDSKARGEGTPDPDQPRNREPATLHGSGSSSGFLKPARTGAPLLPQSSSRAISNRFLIEGSRGGEELLLLSRGLKFTLGVCLSVDSFLEYSQTRFLLTRLNG